MPKRIRVNVRALANTNAVRREVRNGRDVLIVPSATMPDDVVMNEIFYPATEIERSYRSLNRSPAPAGHPLINGRFVSARDPEGINLGWCGAWNENARREGGRVFLDKVIDVARAQECEAGRRVLNAIEKGNPVHTSTGLYCDLEAANGGVGYKHIARNIEFDHDAILLDEEGAATPDQGVGMMVNAKGETEEIEVVNSSLEDEFDWAVENVARAAERAARKPLLDRLKSAIMEAISGSDGRETSQSNGEADMADDKQLSELSAKVNAIEESLKTLGDTVTNAVTEAVKPIKDHVDQIEANQKAEADAKRAEAVNALVKTGKWTEADLADMPMTAINKLAEREKPGKAATINGAPKGSGDDPWAGYSINAHINTGKENIE